MLARAAAGQGGVALVTGEPGIGKTRLLEELAARAAASGCAVAWGRAWELGGAPTYWPWIELLRGLLARPGGQNEAAQALAELLPELNTRGATARTRELDVFALCDAVAGYLLAASQREPVLLVLDDLHAADPSSLELAEFVARALRGSRLFILGSHRDLEARRAPEIDAALSRLARNGERYVLGPLAIDEVATLVRTETGRDDAAVTRMIHEATEGNPLFVRELLRLIAARGAADGGGVPAGVRAVIRERLALLTPATVALLQAAAVVGREFSLGLSAEVAGVTADALDEAAAEARSADLLTEQGPGRWRFSHALVAETLAAELPGTVRARLHRRAAEALERRAHDDASALDELAHHWLNAGSDAAAKACAAAERAARAAGARLAFADAVLGYERALGALSLAAPDDAARRAELWIAQCEAYVRCGERAHAETASHAAADVATALRDGPLLARAALALGIEGTAGYVDTTLVRLLERALDALPAGDGAWRARVMARLASARQPALDPGPLVTLARAAIAMARRLGDPQVLLHTLHLGLGALMDFAPARECAALAHEAWTLAAAAADRPRELRALTRVMFANVALGDVVAFEAALAAYESLLGNSPQPRFRWATRMARSMRALWEGRFDDAERLEVEAREMHSLARGDGPPFMIGRGLGKALLVDDAPRIEVEGTKLMKEYRGEPVFPKVFDAYARARRGQLHEAQAIVAAIEFDRYPGWTLDLHLLEVASSLAYLLRDQAFAQQVYSALAPRAGEMFTMTGIAYTVHGSVDHALMLLSAVLGRAADVDRHAADALALCERMGAQPIAARVRRDWEDVKAQPARPANARESESVRLELEGEYWTVSCAGETCRVRDARGMRMLAQLLDQPGKELHVLELSGALGAVDGGSAGDAIDREARTAYERRARELEAELAEANDWNDVGRRERAQAELDQLRSELSRALGIGGRSRRTGTAVERARVNVRRRLTLAIEHIAKSCPALGRKLHAELQTGVYCCWQPRG